MDSDRGNYVLKETRLVSALAMAANVEKGTSRRERVFKWKDPETRHAGHFADVMHEVREICNVLLQDILRCLSPGCSLMLSVCLLLQMLSFTGSHCRK